MDESQQTRLWHSVAGKHFCNKYSVKAFNKMRDFLGVDHTTHLSDLWTPEIEQKLLMLDGPHGSTLLKAMEVVREHDDGQKCG